MHTSVNHTFDLVIVGAGLAGLALANSLPDRQILLLEADPCAGGRVKSCRLDGVDIDLGAVFSFVSDSHILYNPPTSQRPLGLFDDTRYYLGSHPIEVICKANENDVNIGRILESFSNPSISLLNGQIRLENPQYGNFRSLPRKLLAQVDAFHRIIHPQSIDYYSKCIAGQALADWTCELPRSSNSTMVTDLLARLGSNVEVRTGCRVEKICPRQNGVFKLQFSCNGGSDRVFSSLCAIATPVRSLLHMLRDFSDSRTDFYRHVVYSPGIVCAVKLDISTFLPRCIVSTDQLWSSLIPINRSGMTILCFYITGSNAIALWGMDDSLIAHKLISSLEFLGISLEYHSFVVQRWPDIGPILSETLNDFYVEKHYRLFSGLWYAGEMALYRPSSPLSYGMDSALKAGKLIAADIRSS
jgi:hypothetical protein